MNLIPSEYIFQKFEISPQISNEGDVRDVDLIPGSERSPGVGNDNLLQDSCLENPIDRGLWQAAVHGVAEWDITEQLHIDTYIKKIRLRMQLQ